MTGRWSAAAVSRRITCPDCAMCGRPVGSSWYEDALGASFRRAHLGMPECRFCSAPGTESRLYGPCHTDAVWTRDDVRRELPQVRASLPTMGIRLLRLAPDGLGTVSGSGRRRAGLAVTRGAEVLSLQAATRLTRCQFGAAVAHECMHSCLAQRLSADAVTEHVRRTGQLPPDPDQE